MPSPHGVRFQSPHKQGTQSPHRVHGGEAPSDPFYIYDGLLHRYDGSTLTWSVEVWGATTMNSPASAGGQTHIAYTPHGLYLYVRSYFDVVNGPEFWVVKINQTTGAIEAEYHEPGIGMYAFCGDAAWCYALGYYRNEAGYTTSDRRYIRRLDPLTLELESKNLARFNGVPVDFMLWLANEAIGVLPNAVCRPGNQIYTSFTQINTQTWEAAFLTTTFPGSHYMGVLDGGDWVVRHQSKSTFPTGRFHVGNAIYGVPIAGNEQCARGDDLLSAGGGSGTNLAFYSMKTFGLATPRLSIAFDDLLTFPPGTTSTLLTAFIVRRGPTGTVRIVGAFVENPTGLRLPFWAEFGLAGNELALLRQVNMAEEFELGQGVARDAASAIVGEGRHVQYE